MIWRNLTPSVVEHEAPAGRPDHEVGRRLNHVSGAAGGVVRVLHFAFDAVVARHALVVAGQVLALRNGLAVDVVVARQILALLINGRQTLALDNPLRRCAHQAGSDIP